MHHRAENSSKEGKEKRSVWNMVCKYACLMYYLPDLAVWHRASIFSCCGDFNYKTSYAKQVKRWDYFLWLQCPIPWRNGDKTDARTTKKNEHNKHTRNRLSLKDTSECNELTFRLINHPGINPTPYLMLNFTIYHHRPLTHLNFLSNLILSVLSGYFLSESLDFLWFEYSNVYN